MPQGLQVWSPNGSLVSDASTGAGKLLGSATIMGTDPSTGSRTNSGLTLGTPFYFVHYTDVLAVYYKWTVTISGSTISWVISGRGDNPAPPSMSRPTFIIHYGIY